jgi:exodeoxyribonuclease VII small subunit
MSPQDNAEPAAVPPADLSYTEASRELDAIVEFFERREVDVDHMVSKLERATALVDEMERRIRTTRTQVEQLVPRLEALHTDTDAAAHDAPKETDAGDDGDGRDGTDFRDDTDADSVGQDPPVDEELWGEVEGALGAEDESDPWTGDSSAGAPQRSERRTTR